MKAPDKIYIQQDMINNLILEKQEFDDDVEYIRKDALLEKINEFKSSPLPGKTIVVYLKEYLESL